MRISLSPSLTHPIHISPCFPHLFSTQWGAAVWTKFHSDNGVAMCPTSGSSGSSGDYSLAISALSREVATVKKSLIDIKTDVGDIKTLMQSLSLQLTSFMASSPHSKSSSPSKDPLNASFRVDATAQPTSIDCSPDLAVAAAGVAATPAVAGRDSFAVLMQSARAGRGQQGKAAIMLPPLTTMNVASMMVKFLDEKIDVNSATQWAVFAIVKDKKTKRPTGELVPSTQDKSRARQVHKFVNKYILNRLSKEDQASLAAKPPAKSPPEPYFQWLGMANIAAVSLQLSACKYLLARELKLQESEPPGASVRSAKKPKSKEAEAKKQKKQKPTIHSLAERIRKLGGIDVPNDARGSAGKVEYHDGEYLSLVLTDAEEAALLGSVGGAGGDDFDDNAEDGDSEGDESDAEGEEGEGENGGGVLAQFGNMLHSALTGGKRKK